MLKGQNWGSIVWHQVGGIFCLCCLNANITMGELGEFICFSVNESGSFYMNDTAYMHFSKADHIWFGYQPLVDLFGALVVRLETRATLWRFHFPYQIVKVWSSCSIWARWERWGMQLSFLSPCGRQKEMNQEIIFSIATDPSISCTPHVSFKKSSPNFFIPQFY